MLKLTDDDFMRLVAFVKTNYGINLEKKRILIEGRLTNRVVEQGYTEFKPYLDKVFKEPTGEEMIALVNKLTTNHTYFLREPEHFEYLKNVVLPYIEENVTDHDVRIWCAAASTGQEPYTLAMIVDEYFGSKKSMWDCKILATDISTDVLTKAKAGIYTADMVKDVPATWLTKYFNKIDANTYQVTEKIRKEVIYRQFNLMDKIVYKKPFDLVSCRNVMIYFDQDTKSDLIERIYDTIKPGGYFFIGHAENVQKSTRFTFIKPAIYRKRK
ncbi:MAG: protein-glutamate O-methyltransferase CheR [Oscillospiraceae bacterium]